MRLFVDTSVWFELNAGEGPLVDALVDRLQAATHLVTSVPVLTEVWSLLAVRRSPRLATDTCLDITANADVLLLTPDDHEHALAVLRSWPDQSFSYADATSFLLMIREGIDTVATLDDHFRTFRHGPDRRRSFHVLP